MVLISLTLRAEVRARRNKSLMVSMCNGIVARRSKGGCDKASNTKSRFHAGGGGLLGALRFASPFRNLFVVGCANIEKESSM